jgi:hypothetical protein
MPMADPQEADTRKQMLQVMTTEHFVLQTARSVTVQEANQRASLFLTTVSSTTIAIAFVAQVTQMGSLFVLFSLILLPCVYFIGVVTFVRATQVAVEDMVHARGMARIRHYYVEVAPEVRRYLIHSIHDDRSALSVDKAFRPSRWQFFATASGMVGTISSVIVGVFAAIVARSVAGLAIELSVMVGSQASSQASSCCGGIMNVPGKRPSRN